MSIQHFKNLYNIIKQSGFMAAMDYDEKITLERNTIPAKIYQSYYESAKKNMSQKGLDLAFNSIGSENKGLDFLLVPIKMLSGQAYLCGSFGLTLIEIPYRFLKKLK